MEYWCYNITLHENIIGILDIMAGDLKNSDANCALEDLAQHNSLQHSLPNTSLEHFSIGWISPHQKYMGKSYIS